LRKGNAAGLPAHHGSGEPKDWRDDVLAHLRDVIQEADPEAVEEVKWRKPSAPEGVPAWSHGGMICIGNILKAAVRLTFPKGAHIRDPKRLFNTRLDSKTVRAVDFHKDEPVDESGLRGIVREAVALNLSNAKHR
jgi:hypothetical protein